MLYYFGIHDRFGGLNISLSRFNLCLRRQHIRRRRVYLRLALVAVALDLGQSLCALLTHTGLSFEHRRLQIGHFSCQAGKTGLDIVVHRLGLNGGVSHDGVSIGLNTVQPFGGAVQASLGFSFGAAGILNRFLGIVAASLQFIVKRCGNTLQLGDAGSVVLGAGLQAVIGLYKFVFLDLGGVDRTLGIV